MTHPATWILFAALLALVLIEWLWTPHYPVAFWWHELPGHAAVIGVAAAVLMVWLAKDVAKPWLQRPDATQPPFIPEAADPHPQETRRDA